MAFMILSSAKAETYSLADLEVLSRESSHGEFFEHALDIKPSERDTVWKAMVSKMADAYSRGLLSRTEIKSSDFRKVEGLYEWPSLRADEFFRARRQEIGLRYLNTCLKTEDPCWKDLRAFWEADKTDPDTAYRLAELAAKYEGSPLSPWIFLEVALKSPLSEFYCKRGLARKYLWEKLELDYVRLGPKGNFLKKIDETVHSDCLPALNKTAQQRLLRPEKHGDRELAFQILEAQGKAGQLTKDLFYTIYLLERPSQGELFNYSWNRLSELGRSSSRRDAVMDLFRKLDPLPDEILGSLDMTKKRVIMGHFKANFPEYFDFYARQCVEFYGGKGSFPSGNPTIHCQDLMSSELGPQFLDQQQLQRYQEARKI